MWTTTTQCRSSGQLMRVSSLPFLISPCGPNLIMASSCIHLFSNQLLVEGGRQGSEEVLKVATKAIKAGTSALFAMNMGITGTLIKMEILQTLQQCLLIGEILCFRFLCWVVCDILSSYDSLYLSIAGDHLKGRRKRQPQPQLKQALFLFLPEWCSLICPLVQLPQLKQLLEIRGKQHQQVLRNQRAHPLPQQLQSGTAITYI